MEGTKKKILTKFKNRCEDLAKLDKANLEAEIENKIKEAVNKEIDGYKVKLEKKKNIAFEKLEKEYNNCVWELENIGKQRIISFQMECKQKIFNELLEKMKEFTDKPEYELYLKQNIKKAIDMISNKNNMTICILNKDKNKYERILKEFSAEIEIIKDENIIGGCIVKSDSEIIDNTILTNLKEKMDENENNI